MPAPSPLARTPPTAYRLPDGFKSTITFSLNASISLYEVELDDGGVTAGEMIKISTMFNSRWHTKAFRQLVDQGESTFMCGWDPKVYTSILAILGINQTVTHTFPEGSTYCYYGGLKEFKRGKLKEGEFPMATCTVAATNVDPTSVTEAEYGPVFTAGSGT
jgi:hypothetical protein